MGVMMLAAGKGATVIVETEGRTPTPPCRPSSS
jgi:phosphotransferase system HPr-like phosphotransfer protein